MGKQERILQAALAVVAEKGCHDASIDEIAERAGIAKGTVYLYFRSKDSLVAALLRQGLEAMGGAVRDKVEREVTPVAQVRALIREHATETYRHIGFAKIFMNQSDLVSMPKELKEELMKAYRQYFTYVAGVIERGQAEGSLVRLDSAVTARAIVGSINHAVFAFGDQDHVPDLATTIDTLTKLILSGIVKSGGC